MIEEKDKTIHIYKQVGDKHGKVQLVDWMGNDKRIVNSARVSFGQDSDIPFDKDPNKPGGDTKLLNFLMKNRHTSPFESCVVTWKFVVPLFVRSQHHRSRTWAFNEISRRYSSENLVFYLPNYFRTQHEKNRQASKNDKTDPWLSTPFIKGNASNTLKVVSQKLFETYEEMLKQGIAREQARMVLPQNLYTEYYGSVNLHNAFHFLRLRLDKHAQWEIRKVAEAMLEHLKKLYPVATEAFMKHNGLK